MKKYFSKSLFIWLIVINFLTFSLTLAAPTEDLKTAVKNKFNSVGQEAKYINTPSSNLVTSEDVAVKIGTIIQAVLAFLGVLFLILIIWNGFQWMTADGNGEAVKKSKQQITNAAIGLAIILLAYIITFFVLNQLKTISQFNG